MEMLETLETEMEMEGGSRWTTECICRVDWAQVSVLGDARGYGLEIGLVFLWFLVCLWLLDASVGDSVEVTDHLRRIRTEYVLYILCRLSKYVQPFDLVDK